MVSSIFMTIVILILLFPCGGLNLINNTIYGFFNPPEKILKINAQKIADFSGIPARYELTKSVDMFGIKTAAAQDKKTKQTMAIVNTGWVLNVTKQDIKSNEIISKFDDLSKNLDMLKKQNIKLDQLQIIKKGSFVAFGQDIPYIKANFKLSDDKNKNIEGIIGVVTKPDAKNDLVISYSEPGKYNQKLAENFFRHVKYRSIGND